MNLQQLTDLGGFVDAAPSQQTVTWTRANAAGEPITDTFDVWVRRRSFGTLERVQALGEDRSRSAQMISECIFLGDAKEPITYEKAYQLDPFLAIALMGAVTAASAPKA